MKKKIIDYLIRECSIDSRVKNGMFDPFRQEHMEVLKDRLMEMDFPHEEIKEFTNKIIEGKYPERQAYNKEGFLVTFPTPDYKAKALSTGNYFNYDPTHGKGGMHLVRKAEPDEIDVKSDIQDTHPQTQAPQNVESPIQQPQKPFQNSQPQPQEPKASPYQQEPEQQKSPDPVKYTSPQIQEPEKIKEPVQKPDSTYNPPEVQSTPKAPQQTLPEPLKKSDKEPVEYLTGEPEGTPLDLTDFSAYKDPSLEWAHNQKWEKRDNGNYYDDKGNLRAVIGLDGAAVPATEKDRVSLRQWIDKKRKERLSGEKY